MLQKKHVTYFRIPLNGIDIQTKCIKLHKVLLQVNWSSIPGWDTTLFIYNMPSVLALEFSSCRSTVSDFTRWKLQLVK